VSDDQPVMLRVSSDRFLAGDQCRTDQIDAFMALFGPAFLKFEMDPSPDVPLQVDVKLRALPGLGLATARFSPMTNRHSAALIEDDDLILITVQQGSAVAQQLGREATAFAGEAIMTSNGEVAATTAVEMTGIVNYRISRLALVDRVVDVDAALIRPIPRQNPALRLLNSYYANIVEGDRGLATAELRHAASSHMQDLLALALGATRDAAEQAQRGGVRAARLQAIQADIRANLVGRDLSIDMIAARHGLSHRYIRSLFESAETTFTDFVVSQRLARIHARLIDPRFVEQQISTIVYDCGFGDLSYFNRAFRRRYGMTPSEVRAAAEQERQG
jgi:AraC-like DNA-binding protein